ncbi:hypothetical protein D3C75_895040 [compost metagenome]
MQIVGQIDLLDLANIQALEANRGADLEAIRPLDPNGHRGATAIGRLLIRIQAETRNPALERHIRYRRIESDTARHQALQRLALDLHA